MATIYLITNTKNGKKYVGQTSRTVVARYCQHIESAFRLADGKRNCFYREIAECGENALDVFKFQVIEECSDDIKLERESFWIEHYNCEYNEQQKESYIRSISSQIVDEYENGETMQHLSQKYRCRHQTIKDILLDSGTTLKKHQGRNYKTVYEFDCFGNIINVFENAGVCSAETGIDRGNIRLCANSNSKTNTLRYSACGHHYSYLKETPCDMFVLSKNGERFSFKSMNALKEHLKASWGEKAGFGYVSRAYKSKERKTVYGYTVEFIHPVALGGKRK